MRSWYVNGSMVLVAPGWNITQKINARTTLQATIVDQLLVENIDNGDPIELWNGSDKIFSGIISTISKEEAMPGVIFYQIQGQDNSALADKRRIAVTAENMTAGDIVTSYILQVLASEGITAGTIQTGPTIKRGVFNYLKCSEALDYLKQITNFVWTIDNDKALHFYEPGTISPAPFVLNNSVQHRGFKQNSSMDRYRNVQYVRGGKGKTSLQTDELPTPKPDGQSRSFVLRYSVAEQPQIEVKRGSGTWVAVADVDVGVNGIDKSKKWYFSYNSNTVTQDNAESVLGTGDSLRITYIGLRNLFVKVDNPTEIANRANIETGTSGIYEDVVKNTDIEDTSTAIQYAQGLIATYGEIKDDITFSTEVDGLRAGMLLPVDKPVFGIKSDFLIESIGITGADANHINYNVRALDGAAIGGWEEYFKSLINSTKEFNIAADEGLVLLQTQKEENHKSATIFITKYSVNYPTISIYPNNTLYPGTSFLEN